MDILLPNRIGTIMVEGSTERLVGNIHGVLLISCEWDRRHAGEIYPWPEMGVEDVPTLDSGIR